MWHVIVRDKGTGIELARYSYSDREDAYAARKSVFESRVKDCRENVRVELIYGK